MDINFVDSFDFSMQQLAAHLPRNHTPFKTLANQMVEITTPEQLEEYLTSGSTTASGVSVNATNAMATPVVFACVRIISGAIANLPVAIKQRISEKEHVNATAHPLWNILRYRPNSWQTPTEFKRMLTMHLLLRGNAYCYISQTAAGKILGLIPIMPDRVSVEQLADYSLTYKVVTKDGKVVTLKQKDMLHLKNMTMDGICGMSVLQCARESIGFDITTQKHGSSLFANGTNVGALLKHKDKLGEEGQAMLRQSLERYRGSENAGSALILEEGMEYERLGMTSADAQFIETRAFSRTDVGMFFGVPPHMYGDTEKSTSWGSGIEEQTLGFVKFTLQSWMKVWEDGINQLLPGYGSDYFSEMNANALLRGDTKTRTEHYMKMRTMSAMTINEIRAKEGLTPMLGGDDLFVPLNSNKKESSSDATSETAA